MKASFSLAIVCFWVTTSGAATPAEELLRFVPPDVSFCVVVRDLREHAAALRESPFVQTFRASRLGIALRATPEVRQLEKAEEFLEKKLGISLDKLRDDILGDAVVIAYRPGPGGKSEQEQGLVLIRARDSQPLAQLVERLNKSLKEVSEVEHDGFKYSRRVENDEVNFLHLRGRLLVFSGQETILREALSLEKKLPAEQPSPVGKAIEELGAQRSFAAVWVNPRSFDSELDARLKKMATPEEKAFLGTFLSCWKALDGAAFTLTLTKELEMGLAVRGRAEALPPAVRRYLEASSSASDLWARFSEDALLALGGRAPADALLAMLGSFQTREAFETTKDDLNRGLGALLGGDVVGGVLPHVGPDWGFAITAPPTSEKKWFPSMLFALRVGPGRGGVPVDRSIVSALHSYAFLAVLAYNKMRKDPLLLKTEEQDRLEIRYLTNNAGREMGLEPAFGLCEGYLVIASSPASLKRFAVAVPPKVKPTETPLLRLSLKHLREYLTERRAPLTTYLAEQHQTTAQQVGRHLDDLVTVLGLFDRVELTQKTTTGQVGFALRLRPAQPLRK